MNDQEMTKLILKLTEILATKEDLLNFATKEDLKRLATKEDIRRLEEKTNIILEFAEGVDEETSNLKRRVQAIENIPVIAHQLKSKKSS